MSEFSVSELDLVNISWEARMLRRVTFHLEHADIMQVSAALWRAGISNVVVDSELAKKGYRAKVDVKDKPAGEVLDTVCELLDARAVLLGRVIYLEPSPHEKEGLVLRWSKLLEPTDVRMRSAPLLNHRKYLEQLTGLEVAVGPQLGERNPSVAFGADRIVPLDALQFVADAAGAVWSVENGVLHLKDVGVSHPAFKERLARLVTFSFNETPLEEVVSFLRWIGSLSFVVDQHLMEARPAVTVHLVDVPLSTAFQVLSRQGRFVVILSDKPGEIPVTLRRPEDRAKGPARRHQ